MHSIQVHYCNWRERWKSVKETAFCVWEAATEVAEFEILLTHVRTRPPTLGEAQRKCLIWSADHVWKIAWEKPRGSDRTLVLMGLQSLPGFFFCLFFSFSLGVWMNRGFHWVFCLTLYCHLVVEYHQNISSIFSFFNPTATNTRCIFRCEKIHAWLGIAEKS